MKPALLAIRKFCVMLLWLILALAAIAIPVWHYINSGLPR